MIATDTVHNKTDEQAASIAVRTIGKVWLRIIPFVFLVYIVAFLDRINITFASFTMNKELAIGSEQYGLIVGVFFLGYFLFEFPSNLLLHRIGARVWIARILISWGILAIALGAVTYFVLPSRPEQANFLAIAEKDWLCRELRDEEGVTHTQCNLTVLSALTNGRVRALVVVYFGILTGLYAFNFFAPSG